MILSKHNVCYLFFWCLNTKNVDIFAKLRRSWHFPQKFRKVKPCSQGWLIAAGTYPGFCSMKQLEVYLLPLDGMQVHCRSLPCNFVRFPQQFAGTHLYTWVERGTVIVKHFAQQHNTRSPTRAPTRTARSGVERTNHEATAPKVVLKSTCTFPCALFIYRIKVIG